MGDTLLASKAVEETVRPVRARRRFIWWKGLVTNGGSTTGRVMAASHHPEDSVRDDGAAPGDCDVEALIVSAAAGDTEALNAVIPLLYPELHNLAQIHRRRLMGDVSLETTVLLHEAYVRLVKQKHPTWTGRTHFMAVASRAMRHILLDHVRSRSAQKRGGGRKSVTLENIETLLADERAPEPLRFAVVLSVHQALERLDREHPRAARVVECRFFTGLTIEETAEGLEISTATVRRDWDFARAWLWDDLNPREEP